MQRNIQIQDLQSNYLAEIGNTTAEQDSIVGGNIWRDIGIGAAGGILQDAIYAVGDFFANTPPISNADVGKAAGSQVGYYGPY